MNTKIFFNSILTICLSLSLCLNVSAQPSDWIPRGMGGGGALFSPSISPHNSDEVFIACDMVDVFHTINMGLEWEVVPFKQLRALAGEATGETRVQFTSHPNILYTIHNDFKNNLGIPVKSKEPKFEVNGEQFRVTIWSAF